jgi:acetyl-CoA synthetase
MALINPVVARTILEARQDPEGFWGKGAEPLPWFRKWDKVMDWTPPTFKWFVGGQTNLAYSALDQHVKRGWGGHTALIYVDERGEQQLFTYAQMLRKVEQWAAALRGMGFQKGDRIYMPVLPESIMLMLAAVRIGAMHSIVFACFGAKALGERVQASGSRLVFTADVTYRKGKNVPLKGIVDDALANESHCVEHVVVLQRLGEVPMKPERDPTRREFVPSPRGTAARTSPGSQ